MPRKSLEETIAETVKGLLDARDSAADLERKKKEDPAGWLEATIRKIVGEEFDNRFESDRDRRRSRPAQGQDDDDEGDEGPGLLQALVGGRK
jgi:hypothetical protein